MGWIHPPGKEGLPRGLDLPAVEHAGRYRTFLPSLWQCPFWVGVGGGPLRSYTIPASRSMPLKLDPDWMRGGLHHGTCFGYPSVTVLLETRLDRATEGPGYSLVLPLARHNPGVDETPGLRQNNNTCIKELMLNSSDFLLKSLITFLISVMGESESRDSMD